jgi:hypothetical protein
MSTYIDPHTKIGFYKPKFIKSALREWIRRGILTGMEDQFPCLLKEGLVHYEALFSLWGCYILKQNLQLGGRCMMMDSLMRELLPNTGFDPDRFNYSQIQGILQQECLTFEELDEKQRVMMDQISKETRLIHAFRQGIGMGILRAQEAYQALHPGPESLDSESDDEAEVLTEEEEEKKDKEYWKDFHYDYTQDPEVMKKVVTPDQVPILHQLNKEWNLIQQLALQIRDQRKGERTRDKFRRAIGGGVE